MPEIGNNFNNGDMKIFLHHIYEYQKGVRRMVLCTLPASEKNFAVKRLEQRNIAYFIQDENGKKINIFFGKEECISAVRMIVNRPLNRLTPEEDFIIGSLLGYDLCQQCDRYCDRKKLFCSA